MTPKFTGSWASIKANQCISGPHLLIFTCTISGILFVGGVPKKNIIPNVVAFFNYKKYQASWGFLLFLECRLRPKCHTKKGTPVMYF